jgi:hypothetical protein
MTAEEWAASCRSTDTVGLLLIAGHHVGCTDEGTNGAEPHRAVVAGITLPAIGRYGFGTAQPATIVMTVRASMSTRSTGGGVLPQTCHDTLADASPRRVKP